MENLNKNVGASLSLGNWPSDGLETLTQCPVCGGKEKTLMYQGLTDRVYKCAPGEWQLSRCGNCDSAYLDPRPTPETIGLAYREYDTHSDSPSHAQSTTSNVWANFPQSLRNDYLNVRYNANLLPAHRLGRFLLPLIAPLRERADRWVRHLPPPRTGARLLEVGCGNGSFLLAMRELGWDVQGLEPDAKAAQVARSHGLSVIEGVLQPSLFQEASFDAITLHHVIEHLHNPVEILELCLRLIRPGGTISIITPNIAARGSKRYRQDWYPLQPPSHLVLFTTRSLIKAMKHSGYHNVTAHASFFGAASIFRDSEKLKTDSTELINVPGSNKTSISLRVSNLMASLNPDVSEEAFVTARKPV
jgi:2-polyprenyl-3-methyl-5-hydroxy-6-metoxy-1,4-benzoquinol methylase